MKTLLVLLSFLFTVPCFASLEGNWRSSGAMVTVENDAFKGVSSFNLHFDGNFLDFEDLWEVEGNYDLSGRIGLRFEIKGKDLYHAGNKIGSFDHMNLFFKTIVYRGTEEVAYEVFMVVDSGTSMMASASLKEKNKTLNRVSYDMRKK
ncbi:hypothetical protein [Bdellovibrio reynosensis]|uniref:Lipocalin-like domain-containing protein n=1 Tax=Bdellovibrio reynosensis TaxID=2835041 RepID=A0ABY4CAE6_9BACT|nr:hypothetical protein [Bdellovibrio reynosensis]UOF01943.1 hypothetical protein MNR06_03115 [Bdellovibrio reynosensis]